MQLSLSAIRLGMHVLQSLQARTRTHYGAFFLGFEKTIANNFVRRVVCRQSYAEAPQNLAPEAGPELGPNRANIMGNIKGNIKRFRGGSLHNVWLALGVVSGPKLARDLGQKQASGKLHRQAVLKNAKEQTENKQTRKTQIVPTWDQVRAYHESDWLTIVTMCKQSAHQSCITSSKANQML